MQCKDCYEGCHLGHIRPCTDLSFHLEHRIARRLIIPATLPASVKQTQALLFLARTSRDSNALPCSASYPACLATSVSSQTVPSLEYIRSIAPQIHTGRKYIQSGTNKICIKHIERSLGAPSSDSRPTSSSRSTDSCACRTYIYRERFRISQELPLHTRQTAFLSRWSMARRILP